jgi:hypothetical protein
VQWLLSALNAQGVWLVDVTTDGARLAAPIHLAVINDNEQMLTTLVEMVRAHTMRLCMSAFRAMRTLICQLSAPVIRRYIWPRAYSD